MKNKLFIITILCAFAAGCGPAGDGTGILDFNPPEDVIPRLLSAQKNAASWDKPEALKSLTVLHFTDLHGDPVNLARIVEFYDAYDEYIDEAIHAGDAVICYWDNPNEWNNVPGAERILNTIGNHDCWQGHKVWAETDYPYDASQEDAYALIMKPFIKGWNVVQPDGVDDPSSPDWCACYYYKDYEDSGIRMIVLDCMHYFDAQKQWFDKTLAEALEKNLQVFVVQHYPAQTGVEGIACGFTPEGRDIRAEENPDVPQMECMPDAAFASVDRFMDGGGTFICWLSGHTHTDFIGHVAGHSRQLQIIADKSGEGDGYMREDRTVGTRNQDAFNLVTFNPSKGMVVLDRIGCTRGGDMRSKKLFVYNYLTGQVVTSE